eukprot:COSAG06_NODE_12816_length_1324_cov_2928.808980_1_plen_153_part_00
MTGRKHSHHPEAHHQHNRRHTRTHHTPYHTKRASKPARVSHRSAAKHIVRIHADPNTHTRRHTERQRKVTGTETERRALSPSLSLLTGRKHSPAEAHRQHNRRHPPPAQPPPPTHTPHTTSHQARKQASKGQPSLRCQAHRTHPRRSKHTHT